MKLSILVLLFFSCCHPTYSIPACNAIFNFGDSLSDTGNFLLSGAPALPGTAHLPYGMTFFGHPTGRCSNGRLIIDFIGEAFGLPLLPPFLSRNQSFVHGANLAVAAATALDMSFFEQRGIGGIFWTNYSLNVQLQWFEQLMPSICRTTGECRQYFSKSLFVVGEIGGNDYSFPLLAGLSFEQIRTYVPFVIETISNATERLIEHGAVNLVVPGNPPGGCFALILTAAASPNEDDYEAGTGCLKKLNDLVKYHNGLLRKAVAKLRRKHPHVNISYADFYEPVILFARSPNCYGFNNEPLKACCGGGGPYNFNPRAWCGEPGSSLCADPSSSMDWDGIHLTEAAYRQIAHVWLQGPYADPPIMSLMETIPAHE